MTKDFILTASVTALVLALSTRCAQASQLYKLVPLSDHHAALTLIHSPHSTVVRCEAIGNGESTCKRVRISTRLSPLASAPHAIKAHAPQHIINLPTKTATR